MCRTIGHLRKDSKPASKSGPMNYAQTASGGGDSQQGALSQDNLIADYEGSSQETDTGDQGVSGEAAVAEGDVNDTLHRTGDTIPPNGPKCLHDTDDDDDTGTHGNDFMIDSEREQGYTMIGPNGKKV